ncbi:MAG TPA: hypothetical protein ENK82_01400 [Campylobacterales bacterium]|nr:hypothetical protein [Campylobacterales bacterium]HHS91976.1 hypothetical protein [Campylobacterales bacterium]
MVKTLGSLLLFLTFLSAGNIIATVDSREVIQGDSVLLTLSITGKNINTVPQINEIGGYPVFNTQRRSATNFVHTNGVSRMEKTQIFIMEFRPDINMTIPSFSVKLDDQIESSNPIEISVLKSATGMKRETKDFSLDISVDKEKFYLGESIILNLRFKQRNNIDVMQIDYTPPAFKDFFSKQIGEGKTYQKGDFTIQELNYLLIAKKSGVLTLEPARAKIAKRARQRQRDWFVDVPEWSQISSKALSVEVVEPNQAHDIVGKYRLMDKVDVLKVKANKPVTLKVELLGVGSLDDYDGINFEIPNVTMYSDDAKVESKLLGKSLQSRYQKNFVFIADHNFTIPSKMIRAYDYETGKVNVLKTKTYKIEVEGSPKLATQAIVHSNTPVANVGTSTKNTLKWYENFPSILALALAFVLGVVSTLVVKYLPKIPLPKYKRKGKSFKYDEALKVLYPKMTQSKEVEEMVRKLYAVKRGDKEVKIDKEVLKVLVEKYREGAE